MPAEQQLDLGDLVLPIRTGAPPAVTGPLPQSQAEQNGPNELAELIVARASTLAGVHVGFSYIGEGSRTVPGAFQLAPRLDTSRCLIRSEFGHMHLHGDNAGHFVLSPSDHAEVLAKGWGIPHPLAGQSFRDITVPATNTLVYSPRDAAEAEVVWTIVQRAHAYVTKRID